MWLSRQLPSPVYSEMQVEANAAHLNFKAVMSYHLRHFYVKKRIQIMRLQFGLRNTVFAFWLRKTVILQDGKVVGEPTLIFYGQYFPKRHQITTNTITILTSETPPLTKAFFITNKLLQGRSVCLLKSRKLTQVGDCPDDPKMLKLACQSHNWFMCCKKKKRMGHKNSKDPRIILLIKQAVQQYSISF